MILGPLNFRPRLRIPRNAAYCIVEGAFALAMFACRLALGAIADANHDSLTLAGSACAGLSSVCAITLVGLLVEHVSDGGGAS